MPAKANGSEGGRIYNVGADLAGRNLPERGSKTAFVDAGGEHSYAEVAERIDRASNALKAAGLAPGDRVLLPVHDSVAFVAAFLGAIKGGIVPVPLNTLLRAEDYAYLLADSGARGMVVSAPLAPALDEAAGLASWRGAVLVEGEGWVAGRSFATACGQASPRASAHPTHADDIAFWLYSSGSTGRPKGVLHRHASPMETARRFGIEVLGLVEHDRIFSASKLFFAYGLGNGLVFPMAVGATSILMADRVTPQAVNATLAAYRASVFCGVPTLFASMLASEAAPVSSSLRLCVSAGEALPAEIGVRWRERTGVDIVEGVGSTEMLHIYAANRPGEVCYGVTGYPTPGYDIRLVDDAGRDVAAGEIGELYARGPSMAAAYWNNPEKTRATFVDGWMRTGDKFRADEAGALVYCGRADDMLKVSGLWVSPGEVENALLAHQAVLEAAVIGVADAPGGLVKPKAFVVCADGVADAELERELQAFVKGRLAPHKYPRHIEFVDALPKTATGKIQRHLLREREAERRR